MDHHDDSGASFDIDRQEADAIQNVGRDVTYNLGGSGAELEIWRRVLSSTGPARKVALAGAVVAVLAFLGWMGMIFSAGSRPPSGLVMFVLFAGFLGGGITMVVGFGMAVKDGIGATRNSR